MDNNNCSEKKDVLNRLSRLEGQVRGIRKMVEEEQDCEKVLVQLSAVHSALEGVTKMVLVHFLGECIENSKKDGRNNEELLKEQLAELLFQTRF